MVYVGSDDGKLYAFNASDGTPLWTGATGGAVDSSPAVAGGVVYVYSNDGNLDAFSASGCGAATCSRLWTGAIGFVLGGVNPSSPAVANGVVYVSSTRARCTSSPRRAAAQRPARHSRTRPAATPPRRSRAAWSTSDRKAGIRPHPTGRACKPTASPDTTRSPAAGGLSSRRQRAPHLEVGSTPTRRPVSTQRRSPKPSARSPKPSFFIETHAGA
jgi:hypothetical protein